MLSEGCMFALGTPAEVFADPAALKAVGLSAPAPQGRLQALLADADNSPLEVHLAALDEQHVQKRRQHHEHEQGRQSAHYGVRTLTALMVPLFASAFRHAETLSGAMEAGSNPSWWRCRTGYRRPASWRS